MKKKRPENRVGPQEGPQEDFLSTPADIAIYGGAAGGGKSYGLLLEPLRHRHVKGFGAVIFRRNATQVTNEGGLWDTSERLYGQFGARPAKHRLSHNFPNRVRVRFAHLEQDSTVFEWQGAQIPFLGYDELTHFSEKQFFYMLSRNRSTCGVRPYIRGTTNPDPDSWVARFIEWWIEQNEKSPNYGLPIPERAGKLRWFIRLNDVLVWANSLQEMMETYGRRDTAGRILPADDARQIKPKSVTFIPAKVTDNQALLKSDPGYLANLEALSYVDRKRLLEGNWKVRAVAGLMFRRGWFKIVEAAPKMHITTIRYWDRAGTEVGPDSPDPDWTAGVKLSRDHKGIFYVEHVERFRATPGKVEQRIQNIASQDGNDTIIGIEQDPGQAGKAEANYHVRQLAGKYVRVYPATKSKVVRAKPASAQAEAGNIVLVRGDWNEAFLSELEGFPPEPGKGKDDQVDGLSGGLNALVDHGVAAFKKVETKEQKRGGRPIDRKARRGKTMM